MFQRLQRFMTGKDDDLLATIRKAQFVANAAAILVLCAIALYGWQYHRQHAARATTAPAIISKADEHCLKHNCRFGERTAKRESDKTLQFPISRRQLSAMRRGRSDNQ